MSDETRNISIIVQASQAIRALNQVGAALQQAGSATGKTDAELRKVDRTLVRAEVTSRRTAQTLKDLRGALKQMGTDATASSNSIRNLETRLETANRKIRTQRETIKDLQAANKALAKDNTQLAKTTESLVTGANNAARAQDRQSKSSKSVSKATREAADATKELNDSFQQNALRYALYDVSSSLSRFRDVGVRALKDLTNTGIEFEKNFANVVRTSAITDVGLFENSPLVTGGFITATQQSEKAVTALQKSFLELQSTIPVTSEDLTRIGTLAAQMGVAAQDIAEFTEITAKFSAVSGVSADESATALSRIGQILSSDVQGNYERLASAILKTGVNAIATEQQIIRGTTQIAAIGKVAGFSTVDIVALSSAMSSLGMSPELQRSVITSSFSRILTAVRGSREEAEKFGAVMNMTGQQFQEAFDNNGYQTYQKLLATIASSKNSIQILQSLRLASQRLTPNLLRLGQSFELLSETHADTTKGWNEEAEMQRQFQVIAETTASSLQRLSQAWDALVVIMGGGFVDIVGNVADLFRDLVENLQNFARTPIGGFISTLVITMTALSTVVFAVMTAVALAGASFLGFNYVITQVAGTVGAGTISIGGMTLALNGLTASTVRARIGWAALGTVLRTIFSPLNLIIGAVAGLSFAVMENSNFVRTDREAKGLSNSIATLKKELSEPLAGDFFSAPAGFTDMINAEMPEWMISTNRGLGGAAFASFNNAAGWAKLRVIDEDLASLAKKDPTQVLGHLKDLRKEFDDGGLSAGQFAAAFPDAIEAMSLLTGETDISTDAMIEYHEAQSEAETAEVKRALTLESTANALGMLTGEYSSAEDAVNSYVNAVKSGASSFFNFGDMLKNAYGEDEGQGGGLARFQTDLNANLDAVRTWSEGIQELTARGAGNLAVAFAAEGPAAQQAIVEALSMSPGSLAELEKSMAEAAFFASEEYARAFAVNNAVLADVYKKVLSVSPDVAKDAFHEVRQALLSSGGILDDATIAGIQSKYDIKLDLSLLPESNADNVGIIERLKTDIESTKVRLPVEVGIAGNKGESFTDLIDGWQVEFEGRSVVIPVDPNTEEGQRLLQEWATSDAAKKPIEIGVDPKVAAAQESLKLFRSAQEQSPIWLDVRIKSFPSLISGTSSNSGGSGVDRELRAAGGPIGKIPGFSKGTSRPLSGPGTTTSDSILASLSKGEWVHNARAVQFYGPRMMDDINRMKFPKFAGGGSPWFGSQGGNSSGNASASVNVNVVQNYPTTRDPIKTMKQDAEAVLAGIWT